MDFANLPYLQDGDFQLTETLPICLYVAKRSGDASLLFNDDNMARFFELYGVIRDINMSFTMLGYQAQNEEDLKTKVTSAATGNKDKLTSLNTLLGKHKWVLGDHITVPDFMLAELIERIQALEKSTGHHILSDYANLNTYLQNYINLPKIKAFRETPEYMHAPWNNTMAFWK